MPALWHMHIKLHELDLQLSYQCILYYLIIVVVLEFKTPHDTTTSTYTNQLYG